MKYSRKQKQNVPSVHRDWIQPCAINNEKVCLETVMWTGIMAGILYASLVLPRNALWSTTGQDIHNMTNNSSLLHQNNKECLPQEKMLDPISMYSVHLFFLKYVFINLQFNYALYLDRTIEMESETNLQQHMSVINYHKVRVVALLK